MATGNDCRKFCAVLTYTVRADQPAYFASLEVEVTVVLQPMLAGTPVKNWRILLQQSFTDFVEVVLSC